MPPSLRSLLAVIIALLVPLTVSFVHAKPPGVRHFLYTGHGEIEQITGLLQRDEIEGVQIVYPWKMLEKTEGSYDFSAIEEDLSFAGALKKKLFVQVQDRFFEPTARNIPAYILQQPIYSGGMVRQDDNPGENQPSGSGWVAQQWNPAVRKRYQALLSALAKQFDGRIYGINLPETAIDIDQKNDKTGFTCDKYFDATIENMTFARQAFRRSYVVQYANFWPCEWNNDHRYMSRLFAAALENGVGLGGPDIVPGRKAQLKNSYPFFHAYKGRLPLVAMAVQEPTLTYTNPQTGKPFTRGDFTDYAKGYLGVDIIFWSITAPWWPVHEGAPTGQQPQPRSGQP